MRPAGAVLIGFVLISAWCVIVVSDGGRWPGWVCGASGVVAVAAAFGLVRNRSSARRVLAIDAGVLVTSALIALVFEAVTWLGWISLAAAMGLLWVSAPLRSARPRW
jgi:hypothetical protein